MKTKLLVVGLSLYNGGAEKSLVNFLNLVDFSKFDVDLLLFRNEGLFLKQLPQEVNILKTPNSLQYCYANPSLNALFHRGTLKSFLIRYIGTAIMQLNKGSEYRKRQFRWNRFFKYAIQRLPYEYDVAMGYLEGEVDWYTIDKVTAKKKILWIHNDYSRFESDDAFDLDYFLKSDKVVSISDKCVDVLKREFPTATDKFEVLPNLTSSLLIRKMSEEYIPDEINGELTILSIGRLSQQKGFDYAINAAKILKNQGIQFQWLVIGDGELKNELSEQIKQADVEDCFHLIGVKENPYVYIKNCTVFAQTSRYEGKSVVLDEAKILAKPIVVTNYATVKDQITNDNEGMIVELSAEAIATALEKMLKNAEVRAQYSDFLKSNNYDNSDEINKYYAMMLDGRQ